MNRIIQGALALLILVAAAAGYYFWRDQESTAPPPAPPPTAAVVAPPPVVPAPEPQIRHPLESPPPGEALPTLEQSDAPMVAALQDLLGRKAMALLFTDRLIHRVVATVDALPRRHLPVAVRPEKPIPSAFLVTGSGGDLAIAPGNAVRYAPYAAAAQTTDARRLVDLYLRFYPLFQQAYSELGYPKGYFNDRLIEAIDDLLAAPEASEPMRLAQPKVLYVFADQDLESRSAGQKIMIRMGAENEAIVKAKLREIRQALIGATRERR